MTIPIVLVRKILIPTRKTNVASSADFNLPSFILYSMGLVDDMRLYPGLCIAACLCKLAQCSKQCSIN